MGPQPTVQRYIVTSKVHNDFSLAKPRLKNIYWFSLCLWNTICMRSNRIRNNHSGQISHLLRLNYRLWTINCRDVDQKPNLQFQSTTSLWSSYISSTMMEGPLKKKEEDEERNLSHETLPAVPPQSSYWRFLATKLLHVVDEEPSSTTNPFNAKASSASAQVACNHRQRISTRVASLSIVVGAVVIATASSVYGAIFRDDHVHLHPRSSLILVPAYCVFTWRTFGRRGKGFSKV